MPPAPATRFRLALDRIQWGRGARAGIAAATIMFGLGALHRPTAWASLGVLQVLTVDNGGPYRSRLANILTILVGQSLAIALGTLCNEPLAFAIVATAVFCFSITIARVLSQPLASASVAILVSFIVAYGAPVHTPAAALSGALYSMLGGAWAASFSLIFWPLDPFAPARVAVADVYDKLLELAAALPTIDATADRTALNSLVPQLRFLIETAQSTLAATPARMTARTVRARNLAAMVQAADLLFARILRVAELSCQEETAHLTASLSALLVTALAPIPDALRHRPYDSGASFDANGSLSNDIQRGARVFEASATGDAELDVQFTSVERDCMLSIEVAYESLRAVWTGAEPRVSRASAVRSAFINSPILQSAPQQWLDTLRANLTTRSVMFRHALRLAAVTSTNVVVLHLFHLNHGYWLPMTSIVVLQPYTGETWRRSGDRVLGTVAGGVLAAILAALIPSQTGLLVVISIGCFLTLAVLAVDYAWYCFFLTPTVVLLTLPKLHDWHFAAVRIGMTGLGATIALLAMLLFWPQRETVQIRGLLARAIDADAAYLRAMLRFWLTSANAADRSLAERTYLAPARRACGLANNDAEESLDRSLLEHAIPLRATAAHERLNHDALTFTTYLRRLTQSVTTLAVLGDETPELAGIITTLAARLDAVSARLNALPMTLAASPEPHLPDIAPTTLANQLTARMVRQIGILETTAIDLTVAP